jgi:hypothetical protein
VSEPVSQGGARLDRSDIKAVSAGWRARPILRRIGPSAEVAAGSVRPVVRGAAAHWIVRVLQTAVLALGGFHPGVKDASMKSRGWR